MLTVLISMVNTGTSICLTLDRVLSNPDCALIQKINVKAFFFNYMSGF